MAEGPSAAYKKTKEEWRRDSREKEQRIKKLFGSVHWYYPVHKYIGDIVQS